MADSVYEILEGQDLSKFNSARGREITYAEDPALTYRLPETDVNFYSHEPTLDDLLHPFRPSGSIIIEAVLEGRKEFFSSDDFRSLDDKLMERIEKLDGSEYYKQINGT